MTRRPSTQGAVVENPQPTDNGAFIRLDRVYKIHDAGGTGVAALGGVTLQVDRGGFAAIVGPSGAGKSTILNLIGGVERATAGVVSVGGTDLSRLDSAQLTEYRRRTIGFVWQGAAKNLVPYLTAAQNVGLPLLLTGGRPKAERRRRVIELLELFGLSARASHLPLALSGGEQQRVALAVALANRPSVLLADEPTAEIDTEAARGVVDALRRACGELSATVVMATHDAVSAAGADLTYRLLDGRIRVPAGRARLDDGRVTLPGPAAHLLGSNHSEIEFDIDGGEVRLRSISSPTGLESGRVAPDASLSRPRQRTLDATPQAAREASLDRTERGRGRPRPLLTAERLHRSYGDGDARTLALRDVSLSLEPGEFVVVTGPSGSGKSTLLGLLAGFETPDDGRVCWDGEDLSTLPTGQLAQLRATRLGVVFQALGLFPTLTARENVTLPLLMSRRDSRAAARAAAEWLGLLGLSERIDHRVNELSLGQQQRVAVARALAPEPMIVLADEPTAEMDHETVAVVLDSLQQVTQKEGAVILASHDEPAVQRATRVIALRDGHVTSDPTRD